MSLWDVLVAAVVVAALVFLGSRDFARFPSPAKPAGKAPPPAPATR